MYPEKYPTTSTCEGLKALVGRAQPCPVSSPGGFHVDVPHAHVDQVIDLNPSPLKTAKPGDQLQRLYSRVPPERYIEGGTHYQGTLVDPARALLLLWTAPESWTSGRQKGDIKQSPEACRA